MPLFLAPLPPLLLRVAVPVPVVPIISAWMRSSSSEVQMVSLSLSVIVIMLLLVLAAERERAAIDDNDGDDVVTIASIRPCCSSTTGSYGHYLGTTGHRPESWSWSVNVVT